MQQNLFWSLQSDGIIVDGPHSDKLLHGTGQYPIGVLVGVGVGVTNGLHGNIRLTNSPLGRVPVTTHLQPPPRGILQGLALI
jgi:hypothetical protein